MKSIETPTLPAFAVRSLPIWALLACGAPAPADEHQPTERAASEDWTRIVGGAAAEAMEWPWQVALIYSWGDDVEQFCGGSVIHQRWVLTAAHCVDDLLDADEIQVLAGTHDLDEGGRRIDVEAIRMHRDYENDTLENDVALLKLAGPADVEEVALPDANRSAEVAEPGVMATAIGWGLLRPLECKPGSKAGAHRCRPRGGGDGHYVDDLTGRPVDLSDVTTSRLMQVELPLVGEQACREAYPGGPIDHRTLCAGLRKGGKDSCQGDSGGPLVVRDGDEWVQVGVVSWGAGCAKPGKYGVYTNVGAFAQWVNETTGRELVASGGAAGTDDSSHGSGSEYGDPAPPRGDRALLIGINDYADSKLADLRGAVNDVHNMRRLLTGYLEFDAGQIRLLTDAQATHDGILKGIRDWLVAGTHPGARALLYFAGHGYYQTDTNRDETDGFDEALVPHDARVESTGSDPMRVAKLILDDDIGALFGELTDRQTYLIVDSCHSGTITRSLGAPDPSVVRTIDPRLGGRGAVPGTRAATRNAAPDRSDRSFIEKTGNLIAWTAVGPDQLALEDAGAGRPQGFFTGRFVRGIAGQLADRNQDGHIVHSELLDYLTEESKDYCARQRRNCRDGLTPSLEGPPDVLERDVRDLSVVATGGNAIAGIADATLGHGNTANVRLEIVPSREVPVGEKIRIRVHSERPGYLLVVGLDPDNPDPDKALTQIFPNKQARGDFRIEARLPVEIPNPYHRFSVRADSPGPAVLYAVVTESPVLLDNGLVSDVRGAFQVIPDAPRWLRAIGKQLRDPLTNPDGTWTHTQRWSYARIDYEIVR